MDDASLLDVSWTLHYVTAPWRSGLFTLLKSNTSEQQLTLLSQALEAYLRANSTPQYKDDFNDEAEKMGQLRHCNAKLLTIRGQSLTDVLFVEAVYQRATHRTAFFPPAGTSTTSTARSAISNIGVSPILVLSKSPPSHLKRITGFLIHHFKLADDLTLTSLSLPSSLILQSTSTFLKTVAETWTPNSTAGHNESSLALDTTTFSVSSTDAAHTSAIQLAVLRQVINSLKITITVSASAGLPSVSTLTNTSTNSSSTTRGTTPAGTSDAAATKVAPDLKTIDLEVPSETVGAILQNVESEQATSPGASFLSHLQQHLRKRTGLNLPLNSSGADQSNGNSAGADETTDQPPLYVSKITTAALALSVEPGRVKFANKPVENAESNGYDPDIIRRAYGRVLEYILAEVDRRESGNG